MSASIRGISSMATRQVLVELATAYERVGPLRRGDRIRRRGGCRRRVQAGEPFDVVFLASDAIDKLVAAGRVRCRTARSTWSDLAVAVAVRAGAPRPDIGSEEALRRAVLAAASIGYSTGPSGVALMQLVRSLGHRGRTARTRSSRRRRECRSARWWRAVRSRWASSSSAN